MEDDENDEDNRDYEDNKNDGDDAQSRVVLLASSLKLQGLQ